MAHERIKLKFRLIIGWDFSLIQDCAVETALTEQDNEVHQIYFKI